MQALHVLGQWKISPEERAFIGSTWPDDTVFHHLSDASSPEQERQWIQEADAIIGHISNEMLDLARNLKLLHVTGHGVDDVFNTSGMPQRLKAMGVRLAAAKPGAIPIAEFVIMAMIALSRRVFRFHEALAYHGSESQALLDQRMQGQIGGELYGSTVGILGFGPIGREIALRAHALGMNVGVLCRRPDRIDAAQYGISFTADSHGLNPFVAQCRYLVLALPGTRETLNMIGKEQFDLMPCASYLVNIGRGSLVVEEDLISALQSGKLAGAALDVWRYRHDVPRAGDYPFPFPIHHYNVIMTPHYSGTTIEARFRALATIGLNLTRMMQGMPLLNEVDLDTGY